jgi:starch-binding outer membrane protein, SusD/RagB family
MRRSTSVGLAAVALVVSVACNDSNVPFYTAPTSIPNSPPGIQNAVTGLVSATRSNDFFGFLVDATGFGRDGANYTNTEPRFILYELGLQPIDPAWAGAWPSFYTDILQSHQIIATLPSVLPAYTQQQSAAIVGVVQTIEALNYMMILEDHDTAGISVMPQEPSSAPAGLCARDGWKYVVTLLDSANNQLAIAGGSPLPVKLPSGFNSVSATGTSFSSFNRALAGKAGLELAYAIARGPGGTAPTPTSSGAPDQAALARADSAITASALYSPANLVPNPAGGFANDNYTVAHNFSSTSGDQANPINQNIGTYIVLRNIPAEQDTIHDLRWKTKFAVNPHTPQQPGYAAAASLYIYNYYPVPGSFIPIVRNEELVLVRAQIQIGLSQYAAAATLINDVRTVVGGLPQASIAPTYLATRDALLHEQQISTAFEASADRMIALRMYGVAAQQDSITWAGSGKADLHTTNEPIPFAEAAARGGAFAKTCP